MSDYEIGYGKPPKAGQFQKGQSGNPAGRKKGSRNLSTRVREALEVKVPVNMDGKRRMVTKLHAAFIQQANKAAGGDLKAMKLMVDLLGSAERSEGAAAGAGMTPEERRHHNLQILSSLKARFGAQEDDDGGEN